MWKISRNLIIPRWSKNKQSYVDTKSVPSSVSQRLLSSPSTEDKRYSNQDHKKKQFHQNERFWNSENMKCLLLNASVLEKAGWLGALTILCFNVHVKHFHSLHGFEKRNSLCIFSNNVLSMPLHVQKQETVLPPDKSEDKVSYPSSSCDSENSQHSKEISFSDDLRQISAQYTAALHNASGLSHLKGNSKKAFRHFQAAARLGSSQAFYNLGLCYELGKGTKINLSRAAFCYKKAAMKGHGLASFNLAVYFLQGIGGLPVDHEVAKLLLATAAEKNVPEAHLYIGLEHLENKKWLEAFQIFNDLADKNMLDGKYYLGLCYENGWGIKKDRNIATELFAEAAMAGHSKSLLKLSKCFEEGVVGGYPDLDFSEALSQILADQGNEETKKSVTRLKEKKGNKETSNKVISKDVRVLHNSSSVPELSSYQNPKVKSMQKTFVDQSYLGLITPFFTVKSQVASDKTTIMTGSEKLELNLTNSLVPHFQIHMRRLLTVKS